VVEGPKGCTTHDGVGPSVSGSAAVTSPSLRDREDSEVRFPTPNLTRAPRFAIASPAASAYFGCIEKPNPWETRDDRPA